MRSMFNLVINPFMASTELSGISERSNRWQVLSALIAMSECFVYRVIETPRGFLLAGSIPNQPNTGAIYLYDEPEHYISQLGAGEIIEDFSDEEFDRILPELVQMLRELPTPEKNGARPRPRNHRHGHHRRHHGRRSQKQQRNAAQHAGQRPVPVAA